MGFPEVDRVPEALKRRWPDIRPEDRAAVAAVLDRGVLGGIGAPEMTALETEWAAFVGREACLLFNSGTAAIHSALYAINIEPGDEVITTSYTFAGTWQPILHQGAIPVFVDIDPRSYNLDPRRVEAAITPRTKAIIAVHIGGLPADLDELLAIADRHGLYLVEDACQAHGAMRNGLRAGSVGIAGAFSFYPGKNLGAFGDAGAVVTDDEGLAARLRELREHGQSRKYHHDVEGWTSRLDTIQALVLRRKLTLLDGWNDDRREAAAFYSRELDGVGDLRLPPVPAGSAPVWHLYVVRSNERDALADYLRERGIGTGLHYPEPVHLSPAYAWLGYAAGDFPVTERAASGLLSLPIFPGIGEGQLHAVVAGIREFFARGL
jgi:dTDP-4-amino-4,6-dideoxygalactose transaminase